MGKNETNGKKHPQNKKNNKNQKIIIKKKIKKIYITGGGKEVQEKTVRAGGAVPRGGLRARRRQGVGGGSGPALHPKKFHPPQGSDPGPTFDRRAEHTESETRASGTYRACRGRSKAKSV